MKTAKPKRGKGKQPPKPKVPKRKTRRTAIPRRGTFSFSEGFFSGI